MTNAIERLAQTAVVGLYQHLHECGTFWNITRAGDNDPLRRA
jgi:hypothetical protein